jgi:hypothetical protein
MAKKVTQKNNSSRSLFALFLFFSQNIDKMPKTKGTTKDLKDFH